MIGTPRRLETWLAYVTFGWLLIYAPVETIYSLKAGLTDPFYIVDVIAMGLLLAGGVRSLRASPRSAPGLLTTAWAWTAANFWRSFFERIALLETGGQLRVGSTEMIFVTTEFSLALICLAAGVALIIRGNSE